MEDIKFDDWYDGCPLLNAITTHTKEGNDEHEYRCKLTKTVCEEAECPFFHWIGALVYDNNLKGK